MYECWVQWHWGLSQWCPAITPIHLQDFLNILPDWNIDPPPKPGTLLPLSQTPVNTILLSVHTILLTHQPEQKPVLELEVHLEARFPQHDATPGKFQSLGDCYPNTLIAEEAGMRVSSKHLCSSRTVTRVSHDGISRTLGPRPPLSKSFPTQIYLSGSGFLPFSDSERWLKQVAFKSYKYTMGVSAHSPLKKSRPSFRFCNTDWLEPRDWRVGMLPVHSQNYPGLSLVPLITIH